MNGIAKRIENRGDVTVNAAVDPHVGHWHRQVFGERARTVQIVF